MTKILALLAISFACHAAELHFDLAHGELPLPKPMNGLAERLKFEIAASTEPITSEALKSTRLLYLRAPNKTFTDSEKEVIVSFVKKGGSLLLVLDEEQRQKLAVTGVNDLISPFGMKLTPDTPFLHNCGAIAKAGEINKADRELPYSGGRAVEGGTPFGYQLDKEAKPAQPYAAFTKVPGGGRVIVLAEGMASLFLGVPEGERLSGEGDKSVWFGKDSAIFMEEVLAWLMKSE